MTDSIRIPFGKYKPSTIEELMVEDPKYIIWLAKQQWVSPNILTEINTRFDSLILPFGRHQGKTIEMLRTEDPAYFNWLIKDFVPVSLQ